MDITTEQTWKSWLSIWTEAEDFKGSWWRLLNRDYNGLTDESYYNNFDQVQDVFLREKALWSLSKAGSD